MYYIKFYKKDNDYIYFFKEKKLIKKFLTFLSLYYYIRENKIDFKNIKCTLNFDLLFYHFIDFNDLENHYRYYTNNKRQHFLNEKEGRI